MSQIHAVSIRKLGSHRGCPRVWMQGRLPASAGFQPQTRFAAVKDTERMKLTLRINPEGDRMVSRKLKDEKLVPVIDINSAEVLAMFEGLDHIRVIFRDGEISIEAIASEQRTKERLERVKEKLATGAPLTVGSFSHGGGILDKAIHDGFALGGIRTKLSLANDIREELLEHSSSVNPIWDEQTIHLAAPLQELAFDHEVMMSLPQCDIVTAGLPCEASSKSGRAKNATSCAEEHPKVGHLIVGFLASIARLNPLLAILENVQPWANTASMHLLRNQLRDFGYELHETVVDSGEWGVLEHRKRLCVVAVTKGMEFNFDQLVAPMTGAPMLGQILDPVPLDDPSWRTMDYLFDKAARDAAEGKNFAMKIATEDATMVGCIGKGYSKCRSTEVKLRHPENPSLLRLLTAQEHARCKGISPLLIEGLSFTIAHEVLGQSVTPPPFKAIAVLLAWSLKKLGQAQLQATTVIERAKQTSARAFLSPVEASKPLTAQASLF